MVIGDTDYLFHYTTIEKLALILKNRKIRLNPLCNMDDLLEGRAKDLNNLGKFFYVSSWTDENLESIPMWNMYTKMESGVRIGLPKNPFVFHNTKLEDLRKAVTMPVSGEEEIHTFLSLADLIQRGVYSPQAWGGDILFEVNYTDDKEMLEPQIVTTDEEHLNLNTIHMGKNKNKYWEFQKEWRYMMMFVPFKITENVYLMQPQFNNMVNRIAQDRQEAPFEYFDLEIENDAMNKMIVTPSPRITKGNRILLDSLLKLYNPNAIVQESELLNLI